MLNIVLFGPPGAGKGTQSKQLIDKYQLVHLSTGDILRAEISEGTALGLEAKKLMDQGTLVPDEIVIGMISNKLDNNRHAKGFIFDGFPRTTNQAKALDNLLFEKNTAVTLMLALEVTDEELTQRLLLRGKESGRADDQNEEIIRNRIMEYNTKTAPLKYYYQDQKKYKSVQGIGSIEQIFNALCTAIDETNSTDEETLTEKISSLAKVIKNVVATKINNVIHPGKAAATVKRALKKVAPKKGVKKVAGKKVAPKKAAPKKAAAKKIVKKTALKKSTLKKAVAKKVAPKKTIKKISKKPIQKAVAKKSRKSIAKKVIKKASKKVAAKTLKRTPLKKVVKKVSVKKTAKKSAPKKIASKKSAPKKMVKRSVPKKVTKGMKKSAAKKIVKKSKF
jgi:adenylate kinase